MFQVVFATNNSNKLQEVRSLLDGKLRVVSLADIGCNKDIPETAATIEGNARLKAEYVFCNYKHNCFADDSGLEVEALGGEPGVFSARYAGEQRSAEDNMNKLLESLNGVENRKAQFKTVISLIVNGNYFEFTGIIKGVISKEKKGVEGFGYDPVFIPEGCNKTFAEMDLSEKNKISHRAIAVGKLVEYFSSKVL